MPATCLALNFPSCLPTIDRKYLCLVCGEMKPEENSSMFINWSIISSELDSKFIKTPHVSSRFLSFLRSIVYSCKQNGCNMDADMRRSRLLFYDTGSWRKSLNGAVQDVTIEKTDFIPFVALYRVTHFLSFGLMKIVM